MHVWYNTDFKVEFPKIKVVIDSESEYSQH